MMELQRLREHLREFHHMETVELDSVFLEAKRDAIRGMARAHA